MKIKRLWEYKDYFFKYFCKIFVPRSEGPPLRSPDPEYRIIFNRVVSVVLRETTLTISVSTVLIESNMVRVVSLSTREISEITRLKIRSSGRDTLTKQEQSE